jgi:transposase-like protein
LNIIERSIRTQNGRLCSLSIKPIAEDSIFSLYAVQKKSNTYYKEYLLRIIPIPYFSDLSLRKVSQQHLSPFIKRNHVSIWNWIQHYKPERLFHRKRRIYEFIVDETLIKVGTELLVWVWVWIAIELKDKIRQFLEYAYLMMKEACMLIAEEQFMRSLVRKYGKHLVSTDGGGTWYPCITKKLLRNEYIVD